MKRFNSWEENSCETDTIVKCSITIAGTEEGSFQVFSETSIINKAVPTNSVTKATI